MVALVAGQVYYFHRYAFKVSDPGTSPTYAPTPFAWQVGKYVLITFLTGICYLSAWSQYKRLGPLRSNSGFALWLWALFLVFCALTLIGAAASVHSGEALVETWFFLPLVLALPLFWRGRASLELLLRVVALLVVYHGIFSAYQFYAYAVDGRLPALGYANGLVRFGGGLDDPNGFGIWLVLPLLLVLSGRPNVRWWMRLALGGGLVYLLFASVSYTAAAGLLAAAAAYLVITRQVGKSLLGTLALLGGGYVLISSDAFQKIISYKAASAASRFTFDLQVQNGQSLGGYLARAGWSDVLFGNPALAPHSENSYISLFCNFGAVAVALLIVMVTLTFFRGVRRARALLKAGNVADGRTFAALTAYVAAFALGSAGVPFFGVFPVNMTFWTVALILWLPGDGEQARPRPADITFADPRVREVGKGARPFERAGAG